MIRIGSKRKPGHTLYRNGEIWGIFIDAETAGKFADKCDGELKLVDPAGAVLFHFLR